MAKITAKEIKQEKIKIYLSTGGDVTGEIALFEDIVRKIREKRLSSGTRTCPEIEITGWSEENHNMNETDLEQCDIYIMILWERLGKVEGSAASRVEEEFKTILTRFRRTGAPFPMLYFRAINDASYLSNDEELEKVMAFRTKMETDKKSRFYNYESTAQFKSLFVHQLNQWLDKSRYGAEYATHFEKPVIEYPSDIKNILEELFGSDLVKEQKISEESARIKKEAFKLTLDAIKDAEAGKHTMAEEQFVRAMDKFQGPSILNSYGVFLMERNFMGLAVQKFKKALSVAVEKDHYLQMAISYKYIGDICEGLGELEVAEDMYNSALRLNTKSKSKTDMSNALRHLGTIYTKMFDVKNAEKMFRRAITIEKEVGRKDIMAELFLNFGDLYMADENLKQAEKFYNRAIELFKKISLKEKMAECYLKLGGIFMERLNFKDASKVFENSLKVGRESGLYDVVSESYKNLGHIGWSRFIYDEAHKYFDKSLKLESELGRKEKMAPLFGFIGNAYRVKGELTEALRIFERALIIEEELGNKPGVANQNSNIGTIYRNKGDLDKAEEYYKIAYSIYNGLKDSDGVAKQCLNIGYVFQIRGDLKKAEKVFRKAAELYGELGFKEGEASAYGSIGNIYLTRGDLKKTETMWDKSVTIMRSIEKERMIKTLGSWVDSI